MTDTSCASEHQPLRLPVLSTLIGSFGMVAEKFRYFIQLGLPFALFLGLIYIICGQDTTCWIVNYTTSSNCSQSLVAFAGIHVIALFLFCMFMRNWYLIALKGQNMSLKQVLLPRLADVKIFLLVLATMGAWLIAGSAFYLLYVRVPNPDWRIELAYFTVVSLLFSAPIVMTRFLSWIAFAAEEAPLPSLLKIWKKTSNHTVLLFASFVFVLLVGIFLQQAVLAEATAQHNLRFYRIVFNEWFVEGIAVLLACLFMNYCALQKKFFFEDNN